MTKTGIWRTALLLFIFFAFTMAVLNVDVSAIGPENSTVGFATINGAVQALFPYSSLWYKITTVLGYLALAVAASFGVLGIVQCIKRRSLKKVDFQLIALGLFYAVTLGCYVLFDKVAVNFRPVIVDPTEGLEASYPSSHTMLAACVFGALLVPYPQLFRKSKSRRMLLILCPIIITVSVVGRLLSGVHWLTDIVAALLLSAALISFYVALLQVHALKTEQMQAKDDLPDYPVEDGFGDLFRDEE